MKRLVLILPAIAGLAMVTAQPTMAQQQATTASTATAV